MINNGLDTDIFKPRKDIKREAYRLITTASADVPLKGLDYTLKALARLKEDLDINLLIIGKPKKDGHTLRLIKNLGIEKNIEFKTNLKQEEIAVEYAKSSIAIVSSLYEGFGYPVIEAMSCSIPLIATNTSSIPELVGDYAHLIAPKNSELLANTIKSILSDYQTNINIAEKGRDHVIEKFHWDEISKQYEDTILINIRDFKNADI